MRGVYLYSIPSQAPAVGPKSYTVSVSEGSVKAP